MVTSADFIWQAVIIVAFAVGGTVMCQVRLKRQPDAHFQSLLRKTLHLYLAFPLLVALPCANVAVATHPEWQWDMPAWLQLHWAALSWGIVCSVLAYVFGFCAMAAYRLERRWNWAPACFGVIILAAIQIYAGWSSRPGLPPIAPPRISSDGVILQTTPYTCVPAAGANIAAILGIRATENELVHLFHTTHDGTFPAQALYGLKELGISGRKVTASNGIHAVKAPAMLFVMGDSHAVVYAGMKGGLVEIWNPSGGKALMPEWHLNRIWNGHALEFDRAGN